MLDVRHKQPLLGLMLHRALTVGTLLTVASLAGCGSSDSQGSNGGAGGGAGAGADSSAGSPTSGGASGSSEGGNAALAGSTATGGSSAKGGAAGAGSSAGDAGLPAIDPSTKLIALTPDQRGQFCDWAAAQLGGYGKFNQCPGGGSNTVYKDQADCVSQAFIFNCTDKITVAQLEECTQAQAETAGCTFPELHCHWLLCR